MALLEATGISKSFGGVKAVRGFSLSVPHDGIVAVIGPNGAGKSTLFNLLTGVHVPDAGMVSLDGVDITGRSPHETSREGLARTFQKIRLFKRLTVLHNVLIGFHHQRDVPIWHTVLRRNTFAKEAQRTEDEAMGLLKFVGLGGLAGEIASALPYGKQRMLEVARAMATRPRILLLDEPAAGLNADEASAVVQMLRRIRERGITLVVVEHNMDLVMSIAERIAVMQSGSKLFEGTPREVQNEPDVINAYLGQEHL